MRADMKILITDLNNPNNVLAIPKKSRPEISATAKISTDSDSLGIIEYQFFCFIFPILQAKVWQISSIYNSNCRNAWRVHYGSLSADLLLWLEWMRCIAAFCSKEENAKLPCPIVHSAYCSGLEACLWGSLYRSVDSAVLHARSWKKRGWRYW